MKATLTWMVGFLLIVVVVVGVYNSLIGYETIKIDKSERIVTGNDSKYLVFTEDETFANADNIFFFKFNSSDLYNDLKKDSTYRVKVVGFRIPLFSMYRNIIKIIPQEKEKQK